MLYDPSKVNADDLRDMRPGALIRVDASCFGFTVLNPSTHARLILD